MHRLNSKAIRDYVTQLITIRNGVFSIEQMFTEHQQCDQYKEF